MSYALNNYPQGMSPCELDGTDEIGPIDDNGYSISVVEAERAERRLQGALEELDQIAAEFNGWGEKTLKMGLLDFMKRVERRLEEVSCD